MDLFEKCRRFTAARKLMAAGYYAYFQPISSAQEPEVTVNGQRMIMVAIVLQVLGVLTIRKLVDIEY